MDANYRVNGTLQFQINGTWSERSFSAEVHAVDRSHAIEVIFDLYAGWARREDPNALVRWYSTPSVGSI
jgi:hypothetical protein